MNISSPSCKHRCDVCVNSFNGHLAILWKDPCASSLFEIMFLPVVSFLQQVFVLLCAGGGVFVYCVCVCMVWCVVYVFVHCTVSYCVCVCGVGSL